MQPALVFGTLIAVRALCVVLASGCVTHGHLFPGARGSAKVQAWGEYAAELDVPACPASRVWTVDTTADELDGGETLSDRAQAGPSLSLAEALWLAHNVAGPDTIQFDAAVFPAEAPGVIRTDAPPRRYPTGLNDACIDARGRGVVVEWAPFEQAEIDSCRAAYGCMWGLASRSLMVGLELVNAPDKIGVGESQLAGCRIVSGHGIVRSFSGAVVGPGNVFTAFAPFLTGHLPPDAGEVRGNFFDFDPRTGEALAASGAQRIETSVPIVIEDNVFAAGEGVLLSIGSTTSGSVIRSNTFHERGVAVLLSGIAQFGPYNTLVGAAVEVSAAATAELTRNSITGAGQGIVFSGGPAPVAAPTIEAADAGGASGSCPVAGRVELFSDPAGQGELFIADVDCDPSSGWSLVTTVPRGRNVTATLTTGGRTSGFSAPVAVP